MPRCTCAFDVIRILMRRTPVKYVVDNAQVHQPPWERAIKTKTSPWSKTTQARNKKKNTNDKQIGYKVVSGKISKTNTYVCFIINVIWWVRSVNECQVSEEFSLHRIPLLLCGGYCSNPFQTPHVIVFPRTLLGNHNWNFKFCHFTTHVSL